MIRKTALVLFLFFLAKIDTQAQVKLKSFAAIEDRVNNGLDTTYVLNFWATWCVPCVEELPAFEKLNAVKTDKPVKILLLSLDFKTKLQQVVVPFVKKHQMKAEVIVLDEKDQQKLIEKVDKEWSGALPATLFINSKTKRRVFFEKSFTYEELYSQLLKENNL